MKALQMIKVTISQISANKKRSFERKYVVDTPHTEIVELTPDLAAWLLSINTKNRSLSDVHIDRIAADIGHSGWLMSGDTIKVSNTGILLDGQHRIAAFLKSGAPKGCSTVIAYGLPEEVGGRLDTLTRLRTVYQRLMFRFSDFLNEHSDTFVLNSQGAAAVHILAKGMDSGKRMPSNDEIDEGMRLYYSAVESGLKFPTGKGLTGAFQASIAHLALNGGDVEILNEFMYKIATGIGMEYRDPANAYRIAHCTSAKNTKSDQRLIVQHAIDYAIKYLRRKGKPMPKSYAVPACIFGVDQIPSDDAVQVGVIDTKQEVNCGRKEA